MRERRAGWVAVLAAGIVLGASPAHAFLKLDKDGYSLEATGNLRLFAAFLHMDESLAALGASDDGVAGGVGRLIVKGTLGDHLDYDLHGYLDLGRSSTGLSAVSGTLSTAGSFVTPYRSGYLAWDFWKSGNVLGWLGIDRASLHGRFGPVDITAGRFPINDSVAHVFTPNDFFAPFSATAINKAYKPGVDALRVSFALGQLSALEIRGVLGNYTSGRHPSWAESSLTLRANTVLAGFDVAIVAGKLAERWIAGGTAQGSLGPIDLRVEGHAGIADLDGNGSGFTASNKRVHGRVAGGATWRTTWHNAFVDLEYGYYSDGASGPSGFFASSQRRFPDDLPYLGQHYLGLGTGLEIIPILRANVLGLVSATDGSGLCSAGLAYDASDESMLSVGVLVPWGPGVEGLMPRSEFGLYPLMVFAESRFFF